MRRLVVLLGSMVLSGCFNAPSFFKKSSASLSHGDNHINASVLSDESGVLTAAVSANTGATQLVGASADSAIAGSQVAFPPGALAIDTNIVVQEGVALTSQNFASDVGIDSSTDVQAASGTVVVQSQVPMDASSPFTIAIQLSSGNLKLAGSNPYYAIFYKVYVASSDSYAVGVIPTSDITIKDGVATFATTHFGAFQVVATSAPIVEKKEVATDAPIVTKQQAEAAPLALDNVAPYVVPAGKTVTLTGKNFRPTMTIALGSRSITDLKVVSDVSATFVMPKDVPFGFTDFTVAQDGAVEKHKLFALADKTALPLITIDAAGVCSGVNYYDANGNKQIGTKSCQATTAAPVLQGPDIVTSSTLQIPPGGVFFRVSGGGKVYALSNMPAGTKATLQMLNTITFVDNELTSPKLILNRKGPTASPSPGMNPNEITFYAGDVVEFTSLGNGDWMQIGKGPSPIVFYAEMNSTGVTGSPMGSCTDAIDPVDWSSIYVNVGSIYDTTTKRLTLPAGQFTLILSVYADSDSTSATYGQNCTLGLDDQSNTNVVSVSGTVNPNSTACNPNFIQNWSTNGGNGYYTFKFRSSTCDGALTGARMTFKSTSSYKTYVMVRAGWQ